MDLEGYRRGSKLKELNGYLYRFHKRGRSDQQYFRCVVRNCGGSAVLRDTVFEASKIHNHSPDLAEVQRRKIITCCKERAENESGHIRKIFDEESERNIDAGSRISFPEIESTLYKRRRSRLPRLPQNATDFGTIMQNDTRLHKDLRGEGLFFAKVLQSSSQHTTVVLKATQLIHQILSELSTVQLQIDGTFKTVPSIFHQLVTIHITYENHVFPIVYALMTGKTEQCYTDLLSYVRDEILVNTNVAKVVTDYERGLLNSVRRVFPTAHSFGCWFHYCQAIRRKVQNEGLTNFVRNNESARRIVHMTMALALLPASKFEDGLSLIENFCSTQQYLAANSMDRFLAYIRRYWFNSVGADIVSVHGQSTRTNNSVESFNKMLSNKVNTTHANSWVFLQKLKEMENMEYLDWIRLRSGRNIRRGRSTKSSMRLKKCIQLLSEKLASGEKNVWQFLNASSHLVGSQNEDNDGVSSDADDEELENGNIRSQEQLSQQLVCNVCLINEKNTVFLPCKHCSCCNSCATRIGTKCPVCRTEIQDTFQLIIS